MVDQSGLLQLFPRRPRPVPDPRRFPREPAPLSTSRTLLAATADGVSVLDTLIATQISEEAEGAADFAVHQAGSECPAPARFESCALSIYDLRMRPWYRAVEALESARQVLRAWHSANELWLEFGGPPVSWETLVCGGLRSLARDLLAVLHELEITPPPGVALLETTADAVCLLPEGI